MKSTLETLSPTRVRLAVEVPFTELGPSLDKAYKNLAKQVKVPGFRPGKAPARIIDQRVGRAVVLDEAVQDAIPKAYAEAVRDNSVRALGQPEIELTRLDDGESLAFTAEVDVRPDVVLPDVSALSVAVDDAEVTDEEIDRQVEAMRDRFAVLKATDRPVAAGDYVSIDLRALVDGEEVPGGTTTGLSYEVGSGDLMDGLDEALVGTAAGDERVFQTELVAGDHAGRSAEVTVTVRSVKEKELPALDDEFAQSASEFDTLEDLRADVRSRLQRVSVLEQGVKARDKVLEALLAATEVPLPESVVAAEVEWRQHDIGHQLEQAGLDIDDYLAAEKRSQEDLDLEIRRSSESAVKSQLVLDALAEEQQIGVSDMELTEQVVMQAQRYGISPQEFANQMAQGGNLPSLVADVRRNKALAYVLGQATVTDASGRTVDLEALRRRPGSELEDDERGGDAEGAATDERVPAGGALTSATAITPTTGATAITLVGDTGAGIAADPSAAAPVDTTAEPAAGSATEPARG